MCVFLWSLVCVVIGLQLMFDCCGVWVFASIIGAIVRTAAGSSASASPNLSPLTPRRQERAPVLPGENHHGHNDDNAIGSIDSQVDALIVSYDTPSKNQSRGQHVDRGGSGAGVRPPQIEC